MSTRLKQPCPCGTGKRYEQCCSRWHQGSEYLQAPDAEQLMRSRYSAFVLRLPQYLLATWHPSTRPTELELDDRFTKWVALEIHHAHQHDDTHADVSFTARYKENGKAGRLREISHFLKEQEQWFYVDGQFPE
ncbi:MAG: YchJ family protein [Paenalcaligenes sp.]